MSRNARQDAVFRQMLRHLVSIIVKGAKNASSYPEPSDAVIMADCFLWRMLNSARLLAAMAPVHDVNLIARSMFEGMINLLYADIDLPMRAKQWHRFIGVHNWERAKEEAEQGDASSIAAHEKADKELRDSGFYDLWIRPKKGGRGFHTAENWRAKSLKATVEEVLLILNARPTSGSSQEPATIRVWYDQMYGQLSDWEHWDPAGFSSAVKDADFPPKPHDKSVGALVIGIQALYEVAAVADKVLGLGIGGSLDGAMASFWEDCNKRGLSA